MSQTVRFTEVNGAFYPEIFTSFPDEDEAVELVKDMLEDGIILPCYDYYTVKTDWYEIGEGESGTDTFFSDEQLIDWYNTGEFEKKVEESGYSVEYISSESIDVEIELEE